MRSSGSAKAAAAATDSKATAGDISRAMAATSGITAGTSRATVVPLRLINLNRLGDAEELLDGISASARTAEWNYLKGIVNYRKGWLDNAVTYLNTACAMEPNNMEYRQALNQLTQQQRGYAQAGGTSMCEVCASLYCANACCQCMGGGC